MNYLMQSTYLVCHGAINHVSIDNNRLTFYFKGDFFSVFDLPRILL